MLRLDPGQVMLSNGVSVAGTMAPRSWSPLPARTVRGVICTSMSWPLIRTAVMRRQSLPSRRVAPRGAVPSMRKRTAATDAQGMTNGDMVAGRLARP